MYADCLKRKMTFGSKACYLFGWITEIIEDFMTINYYQAILKGCKMTVGKIG